MWRDSKLRSNAAYEPRYRQEAICEDRGLPGSVSGGLRQKSENRWGRHKKRLHRLYSEYESPYTSAHSLPFRLRRKRHSSPGHYT